MLSEGDHGCRDVERADLEGSATVSEMADDVLQVLLHERLMAMYEERSRRQQNDYLGWISRAKRQATLQKRIDQLLDELDRGDVYMKVDHSPSARS